MIQKLKHILRLVFYKVKSMLFFYRKKTTFKQNVFNSTFQQRVLLSYIYSSYEYNNIEYKQHTNYYTSYVIGNVLHKLGYSVDVINWTNKFNGDYNNYVAVVGLGESVEDALLNKNSLTKVIFFATGCNPFYSNKVTVNRVIDFYNKHGKYLMESSRFIYKDWPLQHQAADWIILHGDNFAKSTYRENNVLNIHAPVFIKEQNKNILVNEWSIKRQNYLWFGSTGAIHKGLDLVLDAFHNLKDVNLHICGNIESEERFFEHYKTSLNNNANINYYGYVDINTELFDDIINKCAFVIFPSASEGNSPSVITCMANGGLIPIVTKSADVNISNFGIEIKELNIKSVEDAIKASQQLSISELIKQSKEIQNLTQKIHTFDYFEKDISKKLEGILKK